MQSITPTALVTQSLQKIGALAFDEAPTSAQVTNGVTIATQLIDNWRTQALTIPQTVRETFTLAVGQQTYTIGSGGNFNTERPMAIDAASILVNPASTFTVSSITRVGSTATVTTSTANNYFNGQNITIAGAAQSAYNGTFVITSTGTSTFTYTVTGTPTTPATGTITAQDAIGQAYEILMGQLNWEGYIGVTIKGLYNPFPVNFYYNPTYVGGLGNIFVWPVPVQVYTMAIYTQRPLSELDSGALTTAVTMPPGYVRALIYNLAVELIPDYGRNETNMAVQLVQRTAQSSLADIKRQNTDITVLSTGMAAALFGAPSGAYTWDFNRNIITGP